MTMNQIIEPPPEPQFTEREVQIYLKACSDCAAIATKSKKGIIASAAIKSHIIGTRLMAERAKTNGAWA